MPPSSAVKSRNSGRNPRRKEGGNSRRDSAEAVPRQPDGALSGDGSAPQGSRTEVDCSTDGPSAGHGLH
eukprot:10296508-Alexandrium_andersonii.AAC.1